MKVVESNGECRHAVASSPGSLLAGGGEPGTH